MACTTRIASLLSTPIWKRVSNHRFRIVAPGPVDEKPERRSISASSTPAVPGPGVLGLVLPRSNLAPFFARTSLSMSVSPTYGPTNEWPTFFIVLPLRFAN